MRRGGPGAGRPVRPQVPGWGRHRVDPARPCFLGASPNHRLGWAQPCHLPCPLFPAAPLPVPMLTPGAPLSPAGHWCASGGGRGLLQPWALPWQEEGPGWHESGCETVSVSGVSPQDRAFSAFSCPVPNERPTSPGLDVLTTPWQTAPTRSQRHRLLSLCKGRDGHRDSGYPERRVPGLV